MRKLRQKEWKPRLHHLVKTRKAGIPSWYTQKESFYTTILDYTMLLVKCSWLRISLGSNYSSYHIFVTLGII